MGEEAFVNIYQANQDGTKFWVLADSASHYYYNIIPYLGKESEKVATNLGAKAVKSSDAPIFTSRRTYHLRLILYRYGLI